MRYLLSQLLPQLHGRTCWVRGFHGYFLQPEIIKWLRFFPQLQFLDADNDSMNLRPGDVLISWNTTAVEPETDADVIHIIVADAPEAPVGQCWNFDAHRRCLSFRGNSETHDGTAAASISHLATTGHEQFLRNLQNLVRLTRDDGADQVSIESLPNREAGIEAGLTACLGSDGHGPAREQRHLDLVADGPHLLIVGTTGSGKSVLLRRLTTEWVSRYCPTELNLVLVDFKGGATFAVVQLPHTVAHLTDLDGEYPPRLLTAIRTELKRREKLFASTGSQDFAHFEPGRPNHFHELPYSSTSSRCSPPSNPPPRQAHPPRHHWAFTRIPPDSGDSAYRRTSESWAAVQSQREDLPAGPERQRVARTNRNRKCRAVAAGPAWLRLHPHQRVACQGFSGDPPSRPDNTETPPVRSTTHGHRRRPHQRAGTTSAAAIGRLTSR